MSCSNWMRRKQAQNYNPPEVEKLLTLEPFSDMPIEEIMEYHSKYRKITNGSPYLNKNQFIDMLNSFNIFPNRGVANQMFKIVDGDNSQRIDFVEFMSYIFLLLDGSKEEKAYYIYRMIAVETLDHFVFQDLINFYKQVDRREDMQSGFVDYFEARNEHEFEEIARIVFDVLSKPYDAVIDFTEFKNALMDNPELIDLFNFLNADIDLNMNGFRIKNKFLKMLKSMDQLKQEILLLEEIIMGEPKDELNASNFSIGKRNRLNKSLKNIKKRSLRRTSTDMGLSLMKAALINNYRKRNHTEQEEEESPNLKLTLQKMNVEETIKEESHQMYNTGEKNNIISLDDDGTVIMNGKMQQRLKSLFSSVNVRLANIISSMNYESEFKSKANKFRYTLRSQLNTKMDNTNKKIVFLSDPNWNIVTSLVNGIQKSIYITKADMYKLLDKYDFSLKNKIEMKAVYSTKFDKCKFKDYAPYVFYSIRSQSGISNEQYVKSIGVNTFQNFFFNKLYMMLSENSSGKSGSFFFHTSDGKYMIKTIKEAEFDTLLETLPEYHKHIQENPKTLLTRYYGLHKLKCYNKNKLIYNINVVVMNNLFTVKDPDSIMSKYDLKGSSYKRETKEDEINRGCAKKDNNFRKEKMKINVSHDLKWTLLEQISKDADFLADHKIIDYSLLVGIRPVEEENMISEEQLETSPEQQNKDGEIVSNCGNLIYYLGIIDTLTNYNLKKKGEFIIKRPFQGKGISCIPPDDYRDRFVRFMADCIEEVPENNPINND